MIQSFLCPGCGDFIKGLAQSGNHAKYRAGCDQEKRFWGRIKKIEGGCWLWQGGVNTTGYGMTVWDKVKNTVAHRLAWKLLRGEIPAGLEACHTCDTPRCCNPDHIFLATHAENMADCLAKGRHTTSSLTPDQVRHVRSLIGTMKQTEIAALMGCKSGVINDIALGQTYRHVK